MKLNITPYRPEQDDSPRHLVLDVPLRRHEAQPPGPNRDRAPRRDDGFDHDPDAPEPVSRGDDNAAPEPDRTPEARQNDEPDSDHIPPEPAPCGHTAAAPEPDDGSGPQQNEETNSDQPRPRPAPCGRDAGPAPPDVEPGHGQQEGFDPAQVFYEAPTSKYHVRVGNHYRVYSRRSPVLNGIKRYYERNNAAGQNADGRESPRLAEERLDEIELTSAVDWAGSIAGHGPGILRLRGSTLLVTEGPQLIIPRPGRFPVIQALLDQVFGTGIQQQVFIAWIAIGLRAVVAARHHPGPLMCLAGIMNSGKSLLAKIVQTVLGGRMANPQTAWSGALLWNDDMIGAELLLMDDCEDSIDIRARRALGAKFKEAIYSNEIQMRKRNTSSTSLRPAWRAMLCCNDNPDALRIIPPIDEDLDDKVILLRTSRYTPPVDASSTEGKAELWAMIVTELPAFVDFLMNFVIPEDLRDSRAGVTAYRDPDLQSAVNALSPERILAELLMVMLDGGFLAIPQAGRISLTAAQLQNRMEDPGSPVRSQAHRLFGSYIPACGIYLSKLARLRPCLVQTGTVIRGIQHYSIIAPPR